MQDVKLYTLLSTALLTGLMHTLIPDHWLPFVLVGRSRGWSAGRAALISGVSATIHVTLSILLGLGAVWLGLQTAELIGKTLERAGSGLLVLFGAAYAVWAWRKQGHFHPGGSWVHRHASDPSCDGREGDRHPEHLHYHADEGLIRRDSGPGGWTLALIVGANPCVLILPILFSTAREGAATVAWVSVAYAIPTAALMVGLSVLGVSGGRRIALPGAARYFEAASGLLIAAVGVVFLLADH